MFFKKKLRQSYADQNCNTSFLRNEFPKIFKDLFKITLFTKIAHFYNQTKN